VKGEGQHEGSLCSQSAHEKTVLPRCAHIRAFMPPFVEVCEKS